MEPRADHQAFGQMLIGRFAGEGRRTVMGRRSRGIAPVPDEILLGLGRVDPSPSAHFPTGPLSIWAHSRSKSISSLAIGLTFRRVGMQEARRAPLPEDRRQLPSQIEAVLHGDVHALAGFRAMRMAGVAGDEHAGQPLLDLLFRHVVELVAKPLADLVDRPPGNLLHLERVGPQDPLRRRNQIIGR